MKLMIASDLHGSAYYTHQLLDAWDREGAPRLFLLGDILYHGPRNDLPEGYAPKEVLAMLNERRDRIFCVRGNCDGEVDQMVLDFPIMADYAVLTEGERLIYRTLYSYNVLDNTVDADGRPLVVGRHKKVSEMSSSLQKRLLDNGISHKELDEFLEHDKEVLNGCRGFTSYASPSSPLDS